jgi:peptide/nickel transport system ATP-binding protein
VSNAPILIADGLVKHFPIRGLFRQSGAIKAVDDVSLAIKEGETFAIVGESGCGKSTLGRLLLRLIEPTSGKVYFRGSEITNLADDAMRRLRRDMQIIFQDPYGSLNPRMTVGDLVGEPIEVHALASGTALREKVAATLSAVGLLPEHAKRYPHEFSGGQRQRIAIARALAAGPSVILGDEPVSALDVSIRAQVVNLLEDLKERLRLTLVLVAHDLAVIRHTSDRVAVMYLGEIVELASRDALFDSPRHPYSQALLAAIPIPLPAARRDRTLLEGDPPSPAAPPPGCRFHTRCAYAKQICRELRPKLINVAGDHAVACHRTKEIAAAGASALNLPPLSQVKRQRLAMFAQAGARTKAD